MAARAADGRVEAASPCSRARVDGREEEAEEETDAVIQNAKFKIQTLPNRVGFAFCILNLALQDAQRVDIHRDASPDLRHLSQHRAEGLTHLRAARSFQKELHAVLPAQLR